MAWGSSGFERPPVWATVTVAAALAGMVLTSVFVKHPAPAYASKPGAAVVTTPHAPMPVAFIGDSYTAGAGTSTPGQRFADVVSAAEGWHELNDGRGGTGYLSPVTGKGAQVACGLDYCPSYQEMIPVAASQHPKVVLVSGGRNEVSKASDTAYAQGVAAFFVALHAALPDATIIATSPVWDDDPAPAQIGRIGDIVRPAVQAVGGTYLDIGEPLTGNPTLVASDGVHPNDLGHRALAAAIIKALPTSLKG